MGPEFPVIYELLDIWWIQAHITFNGVSILNRSSASVNVPARGIPEDQTGDIHNTLGIKVWLEYKIHRGCISGMEGMVNMQKGREAFLKEFVL